MTWAELYPASPTRPLDRSELVRADEWLSLAQTLRAHAPDTLENLGFFKRDQPLLTRLVETMVDTPDPDATPLVESILTRIEELGLASAYLAARALATRRRKSSSGQQWWVPGDLPFRPSNDRVSPQPTAFEREDVDRVLSDL